MTLAELSARLAGRMDNLARTLAGEPPTGRTGTTLRFRDKGSLAVFVSGPRCGTWFDHDPPATGRPPGSKGAAGGDALDLVAHLRGCGRRDAAAWARAWLGEAPDRREPRAKQRPVAPPERPEPPPVSATISAARQTWYEAGADDGRLAIYLRGRGLKLPPDARIKFHPSCPRGAERWPSMVALMTDPVTGESCGVHRTFIAHDGRGKAPGPMPSRMMLGVAGVIRLVSDDEVTIGLGLAEGIETSLAMMQGFGWRPVWAATSAGAIRSFPLLRGITCLTIFADADVAGMAAAEACAERWTDAGTEARIVAAPSGEDFNDVLQRKASA